MPRMVFELPVYSSVREMNASVDSERDGYVLALVEVDLRTRVDMFNSVDQ